MGNSLQLRIDKLRKKQCRLWDRYHFKLGALANERDVKMKVLFDEERALCAKMNSRKK